MDWIKTILFFLFITDAYCQQFFNTMPPPVNTNFTCKGRDTGFYADVETNCRVYHTCDDHGNKFTYYCPAETAFRQEALVCDHAHLVDCSRGRRISVLKTNDETNEEVIERKVGNYERASASRATSLKDNPFLREDNDKVSGHNYKSFQPDISNSAYTRSFKITPEPASHIPSQKSFNSRLPTFILSSSVFLRNRSNSKNEPAQSQIDQALTNTSKGSDKRGEYFTDSALTSTTTYRPFGGGFKAEHHFPNREDFRSTTVDKQRESMDEFSRKVSSTTPTSLSTHAGVNYGGKESTTNFPNFEKVKFNDENNREIERSSASRIQLDNEKVNGRKTSVAFQLDDKRKNDKKSELSNNFRGHAGNSEKEENYGSGGRNSGGYTKSAETVLKDSSSTKNSAGFDKSSNERVKVFENKGLSLLFDSGNFPYSETLRSMQAGNNKSLQQYSSTVKISLAPPSTTAAPTTKVGTEFPIHALVGVLSPLEPNEDDPYYPKRSTTPEIYYKLSDLDREGKHSLRFSTKRPWPGSVDFEIPEVLPDFNALEDLVDRRKLFYIPRVKAT